jgi:hypothetical protein
VWDNQRERDLLKANQEREDAKYWALIKRGRWLEIRFATLQWDKEDLQQWVQVQEIEILKLKEKIQSIVHQTEEVMWDKDRTQVVYNRSI